MPRSFLTLALLSLAVPGLAAQEAKIVDAQGKQVGSVSLSGTEQDGKPAVTLRVRFQGLKAEAGLHGLHLHAVGKCEPPDFKAAGSHYNPTQAKHGFLAQGGPHAGDLPNIWIDRNGKADYEWTTNLVSLEGGQRTLRDGDGTALIIHAKRDDYISQPSGEGGPMIACSVLSTGGK